MNPSSPRFITPPTTPELPPTPPLSPSLLATESPPHGLLPPISSLFDQINQAHSATSSTLPIGAIVAEGDPNLLLPPLHRFCKLGQIEALNTLLAESGDELDFSDLCPYGNNVWFYAFERFRVYKDNRPLLWLLTKTSIQDPQVISPSKGNKPIPLAIMLAYLHPNYPQSITELLLLPSVPINVFSKTQLTPLLMALKNKDIPRAAALLAKPGIDVTCFDNNGNDAYDLIEQDIMSRYPPQLDHLVAYLNHHANLLGDRILNLGQFLNSGQWIRGVLPNLNLTALKAISPPLPEIDDEGLKLVRHNPLIRLTAALYINDVNYRERLLNVLPSLMIPAEEEREEGEEHQEQHIDPNIIATYRSWIGLLLYTICPPTKSFHTWLFEKKVDFESIRRFIATMPPRERGIIFNAIREESARLIARVRPVLEPMSIKLRLEESISKLTQQISKVATTATCSLRGRGSPPSGARGGPIRGKRGRSSPNRGTPTIPHARGKRGRGHVGSFALDGSHKSMLESELESLKNELHHLTASLPAQRIQQLQAIRYLLPAFEKIRRLLPSPPQTFTHSYNSLKTAVAFWQQVPSVSSEATSSNEDTATLLTLLVPPHEQSNLLSWLEGRLGKQPQMLFELKLECEEDFRKIGIFFDEVRTMDMTNPERPAKCEAILDQIVHYLNSQTQQFPENSPEGLTDGLVCD